MFVKDTLSRPLGCGIPPHLQNDASVVLAFCRRAARRRDFRPPLGQNILQAPVAEGRVRLYLSAFLLIDRARGRGLLNRIVRLHKISHGSSRFSRAHHAILDSMRSSLLSYRFAHIARKARSMARGSDLVIHGGSFLLRAKASSCFLKYYVHQLRVNP